MFIYVNCKFESLNNILCNKCFCSIFFTGPRPSVMAPGPKLHLVYLDKLCYSAKVWAEPDSYLRLRPQLVKKGLGSFLSPAPSWQASRPDLTPWNPLQGDMSWPAPPSLSFQFDVLPLCGNGIAWGQEDSRTDCECGGGCRGVWTHSKDPVQPSKSWHRGRSHGSRPLTMCVPSAGSPVSLLSLVLMSDGMIRATFKSCQPDCLSPCGSSQSLTATERSPPKRQLTLPRSFSVL